MSETSAVATIRRGLRLTPQLRTGLVGTLALAVAFTAGRVVVPVTAQQTIDRGLRAPGGADLGAVTTLAAIAVLVVLATGWCAYLMNVRLFTASESALAELRIKAFRHIHDLSMLHQQTERRGSLVSRVTGDVDQISQFIQFGGVNLVVAAGQVVVATVVMAVYSWQLTLVVYVYFLPLVLLLPRLQRHLAKSYGVVRERVGDMLGAIAESVVGAHVIRAYGVRGRTGTRLDESIDRHRDAQFTAQRFSVLSFSAGEIATGLATASVVLIGVLLGVDDRLTVGELTAFLLLVTLFTQPVQVATEMLNEAQNAVAGYRRVLDVLDVPADVQDPGSAGRALPAGALAVRFDHVRFAYPDGPEVLHGIDVTIAPRSTVAVVGETGSGKTTFAKLLTRLRDPTAGQVLLSGVPLPQIAFASLRERVVLVPQEGHLFTGSIADNVRFGRSGLSDGQIVEAFDALGLADWVRGLRAGVRTPVGERGEELSVGERQLVAIARAYVADPDLLVLDEATSAVDPATEVRLQRALDTLARGRTTVAIAHRLSTAEAADEVLVVEAGRLVQRGPHHALVAEHGSVYARLHTSWVTQTR